MNVLAKNKNRITSLFILLIASFLLFTNEQLDVSYYDLLGSKFFPRVICILIIILGITLFFLKDDEEKSSQNRESNSYLSVAFFLVLSFFFLLVLDYYNISFLISSFSYVFIFTLMLNNYKFKDFFKIALFSIVSCYIIYILFQNILMLRLP